jgi:hypothetical protein
MDSSSSTSVTHAEPPCQASSAALAGAREFAGIEISSQSCGTHVGELMVLAVHVSRGVERL